MAEAALNHSEVEEIDLSKLVIHPDKFKGNINKLILGDSQDPNDKEIYDYCIENGCVATGFGEDIDFTGVEIEKTFEIPREAGVELSYPQDFNISAIERLILWMKPGNWFLSPSEQPN